MPYVEESSIFPAGCLADRDGCIQFYNAWGMVLSAIVSFVLIVICIWIWLGECDFESPNVHHRNLFE